MLPVYGYISFFRSRMFSAIISLDKFLVSFSPSSPFGIPIMHWLACFMVSHMSLLLLSFF